MKGHMQDGKFHPHTESKGVRKSRDSNKKTQGVRLQRDNKGTISFKDSLKLGDVLKTLSDIDEDIDHSTPNGIKKANEIHSARMKIGDVLMNNEVDSRLKRDRKARDQSAKTEGIKHIQIIKNALDDNLIKMKKNPDDLNITKERDNLHKQLKQLRKKYNYYGDQS